MNSSSPTTINLYILTHQSKHLWTCLVFINHTITTGKALSHANQPQLLTLMSIALKKAGPEIKGDNVC